MSGITETGFEIATFEEIYDGMKDSAIAKYAEYGEEPDLSSDSVLGVSFGIVALKIAEAWEALEGIYASQSPDQAFGISLKNVAALCPGINALVAARTVIPGVLTLNAGVTVPLGSIVHPDGYPTYLFRTVATVTNSGGSPDDFDVNLESVEYGRYVFTETALIIDTPVSGWTAAVVESAGAFVTLGRLEETDYELRLRREQMIRAAGSATVEAIRADILAADTDNILDVMVLENDGDDYDSTYGIPAHSIRIYVWDGTSHPVATAVIAEAIFNTKGAGIGSVGAQSADVEDDMGNTNTISFDYPTEIDIYINYDTTLAEGGTVLGDNAPGNWIALIDAKLLDLMLGQKIMDDVSFSRLLGGVQEEFGYGKPPTEDLPSGGWLISLAGFEIGFTSTGDTKDLDIDNGEIAVLDPDNINS